MNKIEGAMDTLREAFLESPDYAYSWHANIAMACYDAIDNQKGIKDLHGACQDAATAFMSRAFDVKTSLDMLREEGTWE